MQNFKNYHKIGIKLALVMLLICCVFVVCITSFFHINKQQSEGHFAIIPHFMLDNEKVDQFYSFIKNEYYNGGKPDKIVLISPNHFYVNEKEVKTICKNSQVNYKSETIHLSPELYKLGVKCDKNNELFYSRGDKIQTNEHGIGEHFHWINKYFMDTEIIPIISPCFQPSAVKNILKFIDNLNGDTLFIASVDFAHYQPEQQTLQHDEKSIETLKSMTLNESEFIDGIDADCPTCLYLLQSLASKHSQKPELWWRDSSSTIMNQDMKEENTSRIFMRYK